MHVQQNIKIWILSVRLRKILISNLMEIRPVGAELVPCRQTCWRMKLDATKLVVALRDLTNAPKLQIYLPRPSPLLENGVSLWNEARCAVIIACYFIFIAPCHLLKCARPLTLVSCLASSWSTSQTYPVFKLRRTLTLRHILWSFYETGSLLVLQSFTLILW
jgi:hypothetical protein